MFRRSRFSVRPNVGTAGKTAATPQEAPSTNQEAPETPKDTSDGKRASAVSESKSVSVPTEQTTASGDVGDQNGDGTNSSAAVQRRKRFSVKPKVAPGRPSTLARKSPVVATSETAVEVSGSDFDKPATSSHTSPAVTPQGLQSPKRRRNSEDNKQSKMQPKVTPIPSNSSAASTVPSSEDPPMKSNMPADSSKHSGQVKETPSRPPDRMPLIIPDREAIELSEKAKSLVSSKSGLSLSPSALSLSRLLNDPSDIHRLAKAQKLRQLLREERYKEKKLKKAKTRQKEYTIDPTKMTMRDLIRYLPMSNPMTSSSEQPTQENETVIPMSQERENTSPERAQVPKVPPKIVTPREEENEDAEEDQEDALMVPQVKVAEDGSLIIDEESLTVEVLRAKGPNPAQERDPIFERGSTTTYSSFRTTTSPKPWTSEETDMFFLAISMVGTDFSMICQLFPHRARAEIKSKFKREERANSWRIDKAFKERRRLDIEYFSKLLEKIMEFQKSRKKLKSLTQRNPSNKQKKKNTKGKKVARKLSDVEEDDEDVLDLDDEETEKENEHLCNEGGSSTSKPKRQQKRKLILDASNEEPNNKKNQVGEDGSEQGEASTPADSEDAPKDVPISDMSKKNENATAAKDAAIKPAKLSRGKAPKQILPLGRKWGKSATMAKEIEDQSVSDGASKEQENKDGSTLMETSERISDNDGISSEEEEAVVQPPRPTRYGRVPKPTKLQIYSAKEDAACSESDATPASPNSNAKPKPYCKGKRGRASKPQSDQESKKPKLITLRASGPDFSDEENEEESQEEEVIGEQDPECNSSKEGSPDAFVPATLRSPHPRISVVEETMEELDILADMPDVLNISQDALIPDASYEQAQNEADTAEPCEHQLDLLVDVIDFLSSEHTSKDQSYNEAAQTLLTISNLTPLSQMTTHHLTETISNIASSQHPADEFPCEQSAASSTSAVFRDVGENSEDVAAAEPENGTVNNSDSVTHCHISNEQSSGSEMKHNLHFSPESSKTFSSQTRTGNVLELKPTLDQGQTSRTTTVTKPVPNKVTLEIPECNPASLACDIFLPEDRLTEEPSGSQDKSTTNLESGLINYPNVRENQSDGLSDVASWKPATEKGESFSAPGLEKPTSHAENTEIGSTNTVTAGILVTEPHVDLGSTTDNVFAQEDTEKPVSKESVGGVASASQSNKGQLTKRKPKPNLVQTSRTARLKPGITKNGTEKDSSPNQIPECHKGTTAADGTKQAKFITPPAKTNQNTGPAPGLIPPLGLECAGLTIDSAGEEEKKGVGLFSLGDSGSDTSGQSVSEKLNFSEDPFKSKREEATTLTDSESTDVKLMSEVFVSGSIPAASEKLVTEPQADQWSRTDCAPVKENSSHAANINTHVEDLPVCKEAESKTSHACQLRRSRLPKVKPKPNLPQASRTARCTPQVTENSAKKDSSPGPGTKLQGESIEEEQPESDTTCTDLKIQNFSKVQFQHSKKQARGGTTSVECSNFNPGSSDLSVFASEVRHGSNKETGPVKGDSDHTGESVSTVAELAVSQTTEEESPSIIGQQKVRLKPNLPQTARSTLSDVQSTEDPFRQKPLNTPSRPEFRDNPTAQSEAQPTCSVDFAEIPSVSVPSMDLCTRDQEFPSSKEQKVNAEVGLHSSSESSETNLSQRRLRFPKVKPKPNLMPPIRTTRAKLHAEDIKPEKHQMEMPLEKSCAQLESTGQDSETVASIDCPLDKKLLTSTKPDISESEISLESKNAMGTSSDMIVATSTVADSQFMSTDPVPNNESGEKLAEAQLLSNNKEDVGQVSQGDCKLGSQPTDDPSALSNVHTSTFSVPESSPVENSQHVAQKSSQMSENNQTSNKKSQPAHSNNDSQSESSDSSTSLKKTSSTRRGRLKPRPNVGRATQPPQAQHVQSSTQQRADSQLVSELTPEVQKPVEGAIKQHSSQDSPPEDSGSSHCCLSKMTESVQSTSSLDDAQNDPGLTMFPGLVPQQVPSDPDEPFFILSLTEIPVCSSGEVVDRAVESLTYLPQIDASVQQQSHVTSESLATTEVGSRSTEKSDIGPDQTTHKDSIGKNLIVANEGTIVQSPAPLENVDCNDDIERTSAKQKLPAARKRAKLQVKSSSIKRTRHSKTLTDDATQDLHHHVPSVQPEGSGTGDVVVSEPQKASADQADIQEEAPAQVKNSCPGAPSQRRNSRSCVSRNSKDFLSFPAEKNSSAASSHPARGKAVSRSTKVKTSRAGEQYSTTQTHAAHHELSTVSPTQTDVDVRQTTTPNASQCAAEVSDFQQLDDAESDSREEPTSISQYLITDIFTDVEEA